jgi:hypothetical protein
VSEPGPLTGVDVRVAAAPAPPAATAARILAELGARVRAGHADPDTVLARLPGGATGRARARAACVRPPGLPSGAADYALALCLVTATGAALLRGADYEVDPGAVTAQLVLADLLAAERGSEPQPVPAPVATREGTLWCDLGVRDRELLTSLLGGAPAARGRSAQIASLGQSAGLPLVDFRPRSAWTRDLPLARLDPLPAPAGPAPPACGRAPLAGVRVCDLTAMWSGPLATWLLAALGAEVLKVEPYCRLDGTRLDDDPALFQSFNRNKRGLDLDLRDGAQRAAFLEEVAESDMVVSNFTPRVVGNLGIEPTALASGRQRPIACIQMPAFPAGVAEREWRAYGHGIHAVAGLGIDPAGRAWAARSPYCDALTGFAAAAVAVALRVAAVATGASWAAEVPMLNVALRLADTTDPPYALPAGDPDPADVLVYVATPEGMVRCPRSPFHGPGLPVVDRPAPALAARAVAT